MNPTFIDHMINLVGNLNDEIEEQNESGLTIQFVLQTDGFVHSVKWGELTLWDSENDSPVNDPSEAIKEIEQHVRKEAQDVIDFFKGLAMNKGDGCE